jgi:enterochelin esterase-like enzyme
MKKQFISAWFSLVLLFIAGLLATLLSSQPRCAAQETKKKTYPEPHWVDPNDSDASSAKFRKFASKTIGEEVSYHIYLPPQYEEQPSRRFPVIYWLHGLGGNQRGGTFTFGVRADEAIREGAMPVAIIVFVNGMVSSFYCDWVNSKRPAESVIIKDLVPHIDTTYRTIAKREGRLIEGYSMGGYGAGHLGFKYPELFGAVVIDAGALIGEMAINGPNLAPIFEGAWGGEKDRFWAEHPTTLATKNADLIRGKQRIRIGCGGDDNLLARNRELHELLTKLNIEHRYEVVEGVAHNAGEYYRKLGNKDFELHRQAFEALADGK